MYSLVFQEKQAQGLISLDVVGCNSQGDRRWYTSYKVACADTGAAQELEALDTDSRLVKIKAITHLLEKQVYLGKK